MTDTPSSLEPQGSTTGTESLINAAEELVDRAIAFMEPYTEITWKAGVENPKKLAAAFCVKRQIDGIRAAITLARAGLGHMSASFIRPACEDLFWLSYLDKLDAQVAKRLLGAMTALDASRSVIAQQQYSGKKTMTRLGFPAKFVKYSYANKLQSEAVLKELSGTLGWPNTDEGVLPPTAWVAAQTGNSKLYDFLYSATSRVVHFSMGEVARRGWSIPEDGDPQNSIIDFNSPNHLNYRTDFALYWCCHLFALTWPTALSCLEADLEGADEGVLDVYTEALKRLASHGKVPVTLPSEFNLRTTARAGVNSSNAKRANSRGSRG
ncbi:DUF5677 domain-containing protein [Nonomuraea sp. NBC_00507]|uniref:DUF5677 domain-containing protein n=1 Tax=Nonomuraea sp. NBC_00507 TaxID=2976002 RepID=UPI002E18D860